MINRVLILLLSMCLLQGCIGTAFVAGAAAGGAVVNDRRPMKTIVKDQEIEHEAGIQIYGTKAINDNCHIVVVSFNHIVLLAGQAPTPALRALVVSTIKKIPDIKRIFNEISLGKPTSPLVRSSDAWITTKAKTELLLTKDLHSGQIKVITENGTVYLMGLVTPRQGNMAAAVTRRIAGVKRVVKLFEYLSVVR